MLDRVEKISGTAFAFVEGDIRDADLLRSLFADAEFDAIIHFAGVKAVEELGRL